MASYKVFSDSRSFPPAEFVAFDLAGLVEFVVGLDLEEADVFRDDAYAFSFRVVEDNVWTVFRRHLDS
jgi:hypothetical protein